MNEKMNTDWPEDSKECSELIASGLKNKNLESVEVGLSAAYDMAVDYILDNHYTSLSRLVQDLNRAYQTVQIKPKQPFDTKGFLGELQSLITLGDYICQISISDEVVKEIGKSKYSKLILQVLLENGSTLASKLCDLIGLPNRSQLRRTAGNLVEKGIIRDDKRGKNVWYSLTSQGKVVAEKIIHRNIIDSTQIVDTLLLALYSILEKLKIGWDISRNPIDDIESKVPRTLVTRYVRKALEIFKQFGVTKEQRGVQKLAQPGKAFLPTTVLVGDSIHYLPTNYSDYEIFMKTTYPQLGFSRLVFIQVWHVNIENAVFTRSVNRLSRFNVKAAISDNILR